MEIVFYSLRFIQSDFCPTREREEKTEKKK